MIRAWIAARLLAVAVLSMRAARTLLSHGY